MRLTFLITDLHRGGSPLLLADLAPGLKALGWDTDVVSIAPLGTVAALLQSAGIPTSSLLARNNHDPAILPRLIRHLNSRQPDIVCSILIHANLLATLAQPFIKSIPSPPFPLPPFPFPLPSRPLFIQSLHTLQENPRWHWTLQRFLLPHADAFIAPSHAIIHKLQSLARQHPVPNPTVIPNGINVPRFFNAAPIENPPWPKDAVVIGSISRFDPVKRLHLLLQTMPLLPPNFHLALIGYGTPAQEHSLRKLAASLTPNLNPNPNPTPPTSNSQLSIINYQSSISHRLHFPGPTPEPERWYKSFNIYCNLSSSEGFGLTLAEAACAGIPIVTCDTPAIRETLDDATWLPENPTPAEIARALVACAAAQGLANNAEITNQSQLGAINSKFSAIYNAKYPQNNRILPNANASDMLQLEQRYGLAGMVGQYDACFRNLLAPGV